MGITVSLGDHGRADLFGRYRRITATAENVLRPSGNDRPLTFLRGCMRAKMRTSRKIRQLMSRGAVSGVTGLSRGPTAVCGSNRNSSQHSANLPAPVLGVITSRRSTLDREPVLVPP